MKYNFLHLMSLLGTICFAQNQFKLNDISKKYHVTIDIATCSDKKCFGKSSVILMNKDTYDKYPALISENFAFNLEKGLANSKKVNFAEEPFPIIFEDFNFDGFVDFALINKPSTNKISKGSEKTIYDIYIFDSVQKQFLINEELKNLVKENSGKLTIDSKRKRVGISSKSGCCITVTKEYIFTPEKNLRKVYEFEENLKDAKTAITKKSEFVDFKWQTKTKTYPREVYIKEIKDENTERN